MLVWKPVDEVLKAYEEHSINNSNLAKVDRKFSEMFDNATLEIKKQDEELARQKQLREARKLAKNKATMCNAERI